MTIAKYVNGNAIVSMESNGTRTIEYDGELKLEYPLNIDIRVSTQCSFGMNSATGKSVCYFCHESATTDGKECNYSDLIIKLRSLLPGTELAIGANRITENLHHFLGLTKKHGFISNLTVNQGHLIRDGDTLAKLIADDWVKGVGISYRRLLDFNRVPLSLIDHDNTVFHVIAGIDTVEDVKLLAHRNVKKILILGEKNFGFNFGKVDLTTQAHRDWLMHVHELYSLFQVVSFDNLAIEQLQIKRFFNDDNWNKFYQGEHSMYINAVDGYYSPSSRSNYKTNWDSVSIKDYFTQIRPNQN